MAVDIEKLRELHFEDQRCAGGQPGVSDCDWLQALDELEALRNKVHSLSADHERLRSATANIEGKLVKERDIAIAAKNEAELLLEAAVGDRKRVERESFEHSRMLTEEMQELRADLAAVTKERDWFKVKADYDGEVHGQSATGDWCALMTWKGPCDCGRPK